MTTKLDELEERLISELEEAGFEDLITLLQTVTARSGTPEELASIREAVNTLLGAGLVTIMSEATLPNHPMELRQSEAEALLANMASEFRFDATKRYWLYTKENGPPFVLQYPEVRLTAAGRSAATVILARRGHRWWLK